MVILSKTSTRKLAAVPPEKTAMPPRSGWRGVGGYGLAGGGVRGRGVEVGGLSDCGVFDIAVDAAR